jgi:hypothetical protein
MLLMVKVPKSTVRPEFRMDLRSRPADTHISKKSVTPSAWRIYHWLLKQSRVFNGNSVATRLGCWVDRSGIFLSAFALALATLAVI